MTEHENEESIGSTTHQSVFGKATIDEQKKCKYFLFKKM